MDVMKHLEKFKKDDNAYIGGLMSGILMGVIIIVVTLILINAIAPSAITGISNTSAITGYTTWSSGTQSMWTTIPILSTLGLFMLPLVVVFALMKIIDG